MPSVEEQKRALTETIGRQRQEIAHEHYLRDLRQTYGAVPSDQTKIDNLLSQTSIGRAHVAAKKEKTP